MNGGLGARFVHIQSFLCQGVLLWLRFGWIWRHEREDGILTPWVFSLSGYLSIFGTVGRSCGILLAGGHRTETFMGGFS
jgi:hypothetical protein